MNMTRAKVYPLASAIYILGLLGPTVTQAAETQSNTNTQTRTCTINNVRVDCDTGEPLSSQPPLHLLCPERQHELVYGLHCAHRIQQLRYKAVKIQQSYGDSIFPGGTSLRTAYGLNDNSTVVGQAVTAAVDLHAVQVNLGAQYPEHHYFSDMGAAGRFSEARAISNEHTIVGRIQPSGGGSPIVAAVWHSQIGMPSPMAGTGDSPGVATGLARNRMYTEFASGYTTWPKDAGGDSLEHGFVWSFDGRNQTVKWIGEPGQKTRANAVNDSQVAVGLGLESGIAQAFRWRDGVLTELPDFGDYHSVAWNVNNNGIAKIVGFASDAERTRLAVLWDNGEMQVLPSLHEGAWSAAQAITDGGDIVGQSGWRAVIWRDGQVYNLNELLDNSIDAILVQAIDINRAGRILVQGTDGYYLLVPSETL